MTEKRFKLYEHKDNDYILDNPDEYLDFIEMLGDALTSEEIVDLLNEQHEQINTLRESRRKLISANNEYRMRETELAQELSTLVDENEQLKQTNQRLTIALKEIKEKTNIYLEITKKGEDQP